LFCSFRCTTSGNLHVSLSSIFKTAHICSQNFPSAFSVSNVSNTGVDSSSSFQIAICMRSSPHDRREPPQDQIRGDGRTLCWDSSQLTTPHNETSSQQSRTGALVCGSALFFGSCQNRWRTKLGLSWKWPPGLFDVSWPGF